MTKEETARVIYKYLGRNTNEDSRTMIEASIESRINDCFAIETRSLKEQLEAAKKEVEEWKDMAMTPRLVVEKLQSENKALKEESGLFEQLALGKQQALRDELEVYKTMNSNLEKEIKRESLKLTEVIKESNELQSELEALKVKHSYGI